MKFQDDYHDRLFAELSDTSSVVYQLWQRIKELKATHLNDALVEGDTDYAKGKVWAYSSLVDEIESVDPEHLLQGR